MTNKISQEGHGPSFFPVGKAIFISLIAAICSTYAHAQWLEWSDESSTRLVVSSVAVSDDEEKDMWAADLNNDGHDDVVVVRKEPFSNPTEPAKSDLLLMNVNGILTDLTSVYAPEFISKPTFARDLFIGDFDNDGWKDIIVANTFNMQPVFYQNQGEDGNGNWLGLVDETASRLPNLTEDAVLICAVWGGDITGDGAMEIYFANYKQGGTAMDYLLVNDGTGHFTNESAARLGNLRNSAFGTAVQIHDMDEDGDNDIIKNTTLYSVSPWNALGTILLFNNGDGTFTNWQNLTPSAAPYMFDVADFNLDGNKDLYVVDDGSDRLLTVTGFTPNVSLTINQTTVNYGSVNGFGGNVHAMDIDLDGDMDIAVSDVDVDIPPCDSGRRLAILQNDGGTFSNPYGTTIYPWADNSYDMVWIDINEDGLPDFFTGKCSGYGVFMSDNCGLAPNPSDYDEDGLADTCDPCPTNPDPNCAPPTDYPTTSLDYSAARQWNELLLASIRRDFARPPVHARNLFHFSVAAYDSWAAYEPSNCTFLLGQTVDGFSCAFSGIQTPPDIEAARAITISYACYRLLRNRFGNSPNAALLYQGYDAHMAALGLDTQFTSTDYSTGSPAALGNYIAECLIAFGMQDGSNQGGNYANTSYTPVNPPMIVDDPGNPNVVDINRWQPTTLDIFIDQSGNEIPGATPAFIGPEWGSVTPFSLKEEDKTVHPRNGWNYEVYHDPGTPPHHSMDGSGSTNLFQWNFETVAMWSSHLDPTDGVMWDISPASRGNQTTLPTNLQDHVTFYDREDGGTSGSVGHPINPVTGQPYTPNIVPRGDYSRVLAEFWADGPNSETPPGHWFAIFNYVADHPLVVKKFKGEGPVLNDLEWDVKGYLAMGGAMHDVAITSWGIKGHYDFTRPVHALRAMADLGQCSDPLLPNYHPGGLHIIPGFIEQIVAGDPLAGPGNINVNKLKIKSWKGHDVINNVDTDEAGVGWILAEEWFPYQRSSFVTPPFAGYVSGHSSYSRAAAEVMTQFTGNEFFPGGMGEFYAPQDEFLVFEDGPSVDIHLQWATYRDAADESALSRIWGGIHPPTDDIPARLLGIVVGNEAFAKAEALYSDEDNDGICNLNDLPCSENQEICNDLDDNCNGQVDEGFDIDNDGYTTCEGDCDDNDANVNPGMPELSCNLIDDNCSGQVDEIDDQDGDTYTTCFGDCDDNNPNVNPGMAGLDLCDGIDNDCDGLYDEDYVPGMPCEACIVGEIVTIGYMQYPDADNDGYGVNTGSQFYCEPLPGFAQNSGDCAPNDETIYPGAAEICNGVDDNCNGQIDEGFDIDNDGYTTCEGDCDDNDANVNPGMPELSCNLIDDNCSGQVDEIDDQDGDTYTTCFGDCDDNNPNVNPGMAGLDFCDGIDNDCDGLYDEDYVPGMPCEACVVGEIVTIGYMQYPDADNDGYGVNAGSQFYCEPLPGFAQNSGDCVPNDGTIYPGAPEICNGVDDNCNGQVDEGFDLDNDGYTTCEGDCNDNNAAINPDAIEICNNTDDDCDGLTDEGIGQTWFVDLDGDGYGNSSATTIACNQPTGYAAQGGDCDDNNNAIKPGAIEICNTIDDDCDGLIDEGLGQIWYADTDNDGYGSDNVTLTACLQPTGYTALGGDCDDNNNAVKPGAIEVCNTIDDDCDGLIDEGLLATYYLDTDGDGYGDDQLTLEACSLPTGYAFVGGDCFDNDAAINPGESEICGNGVDDNCDGIQTGDNVELICPTISLVQCSDLDNMEQPVLVGGCPTDEVLVEYFVDYDANDCAYNVTVSAIALRGEDIIATCEVMIPVSDIEAPVFNSFADITVSLPSGESTVVVNYSPTAFDNCHDVTLVCIPPSGTAFGPGTTSVTCTAEDACGNFSILEFDVIVSSDALWYQDSDGDGYGNPNVSIVSPTPPTGYVSDSTDCNDSAFAINPGAVEICNGIDDDCDEQIDEGYDTDGDGYTDCQGDCDDNNNAIYPGAAEICNNIDDDCDGLTDEGVGFTWYADADNDGYGDINTALIACTQPTGYIAQGGDCDDSNNAINPGASEICFNGIDEDCDGTADDGCPAVANDWKEYAINLNVGAYNVCSNISGNIALATTSPESQSTAITGQDLWYSFVALSPGVQIKVTTTAFNAMIELQTSAGILIDQENYQSNKGSEHLNIGNLTPGAMYYIAVRNYNSAQGTGTFNLCLTDLPASGCLTPAASYNMCSKFKAIVVNATNYVYNFTSTQTNIAYSRTQPSAILDLYKVMGMPTGSNYVARVDASYTVTRGNGSSETVVVQGVSTCTFSFSADPLLILATTQDCPSPRPLGVNIRSNTTVCYASMYQWEFQKADLTEPAFTINGGSTQYLMITSALGFVPGTTYNVRIRVTYQNGYTNPWGPWKCLLIAGGAGMTEYFDNETGEYSFDRSGEEMDIVLYPNPNLGHVLNIEIAGIETGLVDMQLLDGMGKLIAIKQIQVEGFTLMNWEFEHDLAAGIYFIQFIHDNKRYSEKIIVE